jgi:hypothetical protein
MIFCHAERKKVLIHSSGYLYGCKEQMGGKSHSIELQCNVFLLLNGHCCKHFELKNYDTLLQHKKSFAFVTLWQIEKRDNFLIQRHRKTIFAFNARRQFQDSIFRVFRLPILSLSLSLSLVLLQNCFIDSLHRIEATYRHTHVHIHTHLRIHSIEWHVNNLISYVKRNP